MALPSSVMTEFLTFAMSAATRSQLYRRRTLGRTCIVRWLTYGFCRQTYVVRRKRLRIIDAVHDKLDGPCLNQPTVLQDIGRREEYYISCRVHCLDVRFEPDASCKP